MFFRDVEVIRSHPKLLEPSYKYFGSIVPDLHEMRIVCLLRAVTPGCVANTVSFALAIFYIRYNESFEVLQAKVKRFSVLSRVHQISKSPGKMARLMYL